MNNRIRTFLSLAAALELGTGVGLSQNTDILINDFEGSNYGDWIASGAAFGNGPAYGTLAGQMPVDGFLGNGLVNSFNGGDESTGRLTSPPFNIERQYIQFLIGGGGWESRTCLNLLVNGRVVRTATGPNVDPGGSERLQPAQWDVAEFLGEEAVLEIVDDSTGGWGHINADQIVQSDTRIAVETVLHGATRAIEINEAYLNFPVKNGAPSRRISLWVDGEEERSFDIELADAKPDWWAFMDANPFQGQTITVRVNRLREGSTGLSSIDQSSEIKDQNTLYRETLRPQFHFTSRRGWLNDPNGLVYFDGEYHLFYQHNPYGWNWGNMHWGHAVSKDLVHWRELPVALYPDEHGTMYSGSAVVDWNNTAGFQTGKDPAIVAMFTAAGRPFTQGLAYSNDRGRTWTKYEHNPVLGHIVAENRDPKVVWYSPDRKWVMSLYLDRNDFALFESHDLKRWSKLQDFKLPDDGECPNFFEISRSSDPHDTRWVFMGANGLYVIGAFDGHNFTPETQPQRIQNGNCWYAAQVYSDLPEGVARSILVPWGRLPDGEIFRDMPFNQMMGLPVELKLTSTDSSPTLEVRPVRELELLRGHTHRIKPRQIAPGENPLAGIEGELFEIEAEIAVGDAKEISFDLRGVLVTYDVAKRQLSCLGSHSTLSPSNGKISLHLFVDRSAVDIFGAAGRLYMPMATAMSPSNRTLKLFCTGGNCDVTSLTVHELKSAW